MSYQACEDCGCRMYGGFCTNCDEEIFIEEQYAADGESAPPIIAAMAAEQRWNRKRKELLSDDLR
jgi:hypothetical protein